MTCSDIVQYPWSNKWHVVNCLYYQIYQLIDKILQSLIFAFHINELSERLIQLCGVWLRVNVFRNLRTVKARCFLSFLERFASKKNNYRLVNCEINKAQATWYVTLFIVSLLLQIVSLYFSWKFHFSSSLLSVVSKVFELKITNYETRNHWE